MLDTSKPIFKPEFIWASNPPGSSDIQNPGDSKKSQGFRYGEIPIHSIFNWYGNTFSNYCAHLNLNGIPRWDSETNYTKGALTLASDDTLYMAVVENTDEDPSSGSIYWKTFTKNLEDLEDVIIKNPQTGDVIHQVMYEDEDNSDTIEYLKVWENTPGKNILEIKELINVLGAEINGSILIQLESTNFDKVFNITPPHYLVTYITFNDLIDVSYSPGTDTDPGDILGYDGSAWNGKNVEGYVRWSEILFSDTSFNPQTSSVDTIGGFFLDLQNSDELTINLVPKQIPNPPENVKATKDSSTDVTITWDTPSTGVSPTKYIIYRNDKHIGETVDETTTTFVDINSAFDKLNKYNVYSYNLEGMSLASNDAYGAKTTTLSAPNNFVASNYESTNFVTCSWESVKGAASYNIYRKRPSDSNFTFAANSNTNTIDIYEKAGITAEYLVRTVNINGIESNDSNSDEGTTSENPGIKIYRTNGNFYIPKGYNNIKLQMQGGGGSGAIGEPDGYHSGGGFAGEYVEKIIDASNIDMIQVFSGNGGIPSAYDSASDGVDGSRSRIIIHFSSGGYKMINAAGGLGGKMKDVKYQGNGESLKSDVTGLYYKDGLHSQRPQEISCYGGQASNFGNGGSRSGQTTGPAAGGSAISFKEQIYDNPEFCIGGDGVIVFSWGYEDENTETLDEEISSFSISQNLLNEFPNEIIK